MERGFDRYSITYQALKQLAEVSVSSNMSELSETSPEVCKALQSKNPVRTAAGLSGNSNAQESGVSPCLCLNLDNTWSLLFAFFLVVVAGLLSSLGFCSFGS